MHRSDDQLIFFATDLSNFLACPQLTLLNRRTAFGGPKPPQYDDPGIPVLQQRGLEHEHAFLAKLRAAGKRITEIVDLEDIYGIEKWQRLHEQTVAAMRAGVDVVYQGTLFNAPWGGRPDFLVRVEVPSELGAWSYEVVDTKLAREAKAGALLQVLHYAHLVRDVQGVLPERVHIALGGPDAHEESFRVADYAAYFRSVRRRFESFVASNPELAVAPDPVEHCGLCAWSGICDKERHDVDHLSLVAGITSGQRRKLRENDVDTLTAFADAPCADKKLARVHAQALIQLQGRRANANKFELLPVLPELGLAALPEPNAGDLFFDLEGDPYAHTYGIEYLFGWVDARGEYSAQWSLTPEQERHAFEAFIDFVMARLEVYPDLHIYHYNHYETTALKRLMGRYGTREDEVDRLLRGGVFVDLYRVLRNGLRASVESYSIKRLEPFYGYDRVVDMREANRALANFCAALELGLQTTSDAAIEGYNRDDCVSTLRLRDWLESLRTSDIPRPVVKDPDPDEEQEQQQEEVARVVAQLMALGTREGEVLGHLLEYHRREKKTWWWDYYRRKGLADDEILEDRTMIGGLELIDQWKDPTPRARSTIYRYRYPRQEHSLKAGDKTENPAIDKQSTGEVVAVDDVACTIDLKRATVIDHPTAILEYDFIGDTAQRKRLQELGEAYARAEARGCAVDLLHVRPGTVLGIQGPPGAGKTYTAARMIVKLLAEGKRVGVTANSHKVIGKLLEEVCGAAAEKGVVVNGIQKADDDDWCQLAAIEQTEKTPQLIAALATGAKQLAAGTAWLWASQDMANAVDVLFIDEAGQFALADALAVAHATETLVLLGDPQQLDKPQKGAHPPGVAVSALGHMLGEHTTMPAERGLFLDKTWRLPRAICEFTSELFYDGRLETREGAVAGEVRLSTVAHAGNTNESVEEAAVVAELVAQLCASGYALEDILIVAPYNLQVAEITERVPGARVGTVDKFQGQEAKVAIYSMATSSALDAPRGMKFLYSGNRFNVATSRAKEIAVVVASPEVFAPECRTPEQMRLANAFCRFMEIASATKGIYLTRSREGTKSLPVHPHLPGV